MRFFRQAYLLLFDKLEIKRSLPQLSDFVFEATPNCDPVSLELYLHGVAVNLTKAIYPECKLL